ncbi:MAG: hypothetical protein ACYSYU_07410 [Planctomycetota bacterium]|jgi:hypothetical protein
MSERDTEYRSLCSNCRNAADCTFRKKRLKPSLYCEEFEIDTSPLAETAPQNKSAANTPIDVEDEDSGKFIGLCINCDNRKTCDFPTPEGGIWHCEEYQ